MNIGSLLARHARHWPHRAAVVCGDQRLSFAQAAARSTRLAGALHALGLRAGDSLAIVLPNCADLLDAYRAAATLGLVAVPLSPLLRGAGLASLLRDCGARAVIGCTSLADALDEARAEAPDVPADRWLLTDGARAGHRDLRPLVAAASADAPPLADVGGAHPCNIIYSSGTTGQPKGIVLSHDVRALYGALFSSQFRITPESVVMHAGSLVFNGAFVTLMPAWLQGCTYVLQEKFDAVAFVEAVEREQVTHVMMVPSQIVAVLGAPNATAHALRSLRMLCSVGAPWHREHKERFLKLLPDALYELYGLTEGFITVLDRRDFAAHVDTVGVPIAFSELRIAGPDGRDVPAGEVGEIVGRSPLLMSGYHGRPDLTADAVIDGWLHTGDLGVVDADGYLRLVDRKKDMIISGGVNVFPKDIEEVAARHPDVREVAVFGAPSEKWGECPVAAIVLREGAARDPDALAEWINTRLAARYQQVRDVVLVDDLPRSTAGKTLKRVLRDQYATPVGASASRAPRSLATFSTTSSTTSS